MSGNTFGKNFTVTTFGESHGIALGCIIDGCPPQIEINEAPKPRATNAFIISLLSTFKLIKTI